MSSVALRFSATDDGLEASFRRVSRQMDSFERAATRATSAIGAGFKDLIPIIGGISFAAIAKEAFDFSDALTKATASTGIAVDSLQKLQFTAAQADVDFGSMTRAVNRMQVALVDSEEGSDKARAAIERLGLSTADFQNLSPDKQFERVASSLADMHDQAQRVAAATDLFGRSGAELLPVLVATGEQLTETEKQLASIGGVVATDAVEKVDALGDGFGALKTGVVSAGVEILAFASGPLGALIEQASLAVRSLRLLFGGGTELERLQQKLEFLQAEGNSSLPWVFNMGLSDKGGLILGPSEINAAIASVGREIDLLKAKASDVPGLQTFNFGDFGVQNPFPNAGGKAKVPELTPEQRRAAADAKGPNGLDFSQENLQLEEINQAHLDELLRQTTEYADIRFNTESALASSLAAMRQQYGVEEINFEELKAASITDIQASLATSGMQIAATLFGHNKKVAIAIAAVNVGKAATEALTLPFPANLAAVAKVLAVGAQLTASIRNANIGSTGGYGGVSAGGVGGSASRDVEKAATPTGATASASTTIQILGPIAGPRSIEWLVDELKKQLDRDVVLIGSGSRQAGDLK